MTSTARGESLASKQPSAKQPPDEQVPAEPCACGHALAEHDALASRYCQATERGGLDRGCMCASAAKPTLHYGRAR